MQKNRDIHSGEAISSDDESVGSSSESGKPKVMVQGKHVQWRKIAGDTSRFYGRGRKSLKTRKLINMTVLGESGASVTLCNLFMAKMRGAASDKGEGEEYDLVDAQGNMMVVSATNTIYLVP